VSNGPANKMVARLRDFLSFVAGLALLYHETVVTPDPPGPRIVLLAIAVPLLGIAPAAIANRWLGGASPFVDPKTTQDNSPDEQESNAAR
jgi:hypothetical protein